MASLRAVSKSRGVFCLVTWLAAACVLIALPASGDDDVRLPLKRVVLFTSSVGYFEHEGQITGDQDVELKFHVDNINDLLKSMVLQDLDGGQISRVSYEMQDPVERTLRTFAIDLTHTSSLGDLLRQLRGQRVQINTPEPVSGVVVGVERRRTVTAQNQVAETEFLNLKTATGLRSVPLANIVETKLLDEKLDRDFQQALDVLANAHSTDKKTVTLAFRGKGKRNVRTGYIQEFPVWKTSYRLVLNDDGQPFLQGWAIVENTTEHDWDQVEMTLVSGRPISFVMDLYEPLYLTRPLVQPESFAALRPRVYDQDLAGKEAEFRAIAAGERRSGGGAKPSWIAGGGLGGGGGMGGGGMGGMGGGMSGRPFVTGVVPVVTPDSGNKANDPSRVDLSKGVSTAAQGDDAGEMFRYVIKSPVSLGRQRSAMLPIVNGPVDGEKVGVYNPAVHAKHPLSGLKLKNSSGLHLMQGPITVFDGGEYAGDSRIADLPPGSTRLITYALDQDTEVAPKIIGTKRTLAHLRPELELVDIDAAHAGATDAFVSESESVKIIQGVLHKTRKLTRRTAYLVKNSGDKLKKILIEKPIDMDWQLVSPREPAETTRDLYRFAVQAAPGKTARLEIDEVKISHEEINFGSFNSDRIQLLLQSHGENAKLRTALTEILRRQQEISAVAQARGELEKSIAEIDHEQSRIRQNIAAIDKTSDLYTRYIKKFTQQEEQIEELRPQIKELQADETEKRRALEEYLLELNVE